MTAIRTSFSLNKLKSFVKDDLTLMDEVINTRITGKEQLIFSLSNHLIASGGKRLRPILTILCAKLFDYQGTRHINLAAAIEFIHTATLLHDDVVDESELRRGTATANSKWGNKASILVGDFLLSQAFKIMAHDGSIEALEILSSASAIISEGEVMQLEATSNISINQQQYLDIIKAKTAELFAASCEISAVITNRPTKEQEALRSFGMYLGIAFQIIDDALDYSSNQTELGKEIGNDFKEGKITLPVLIAFKHANEEERVFWLRTMHRLDQQHDDLAKAIKLINQHDAFSYCLTEAKIYIAKAKTQLEMFETSEAKELLLDILDFAIERSY